MSNLNFFVFNDLASSAKIIGPCEWIFYTNANFQGDPCILAPGDYPSPYYWGHRDSRLTSVRALPPKETTAIALFQHHFEGAMIVLYESHSNIHLKGFYDIASSAVVTGGRWRLYEHINYAGSHSTFPGPGHYFNFRTLAVGNDRASSVELL